jgi:hypothetical protein
VDDIAPMAAVCRAFQLHQKRSSDGGYSVGIGRAWKPVPPHRWHFTFLSPSLMRPLPSQFAHFGFFFAGFAMTTISWEYP